jgi:protein TonB
VVLSLNDRQTQGWAISVAFHALLLVALLVISVNFDSRMESLAELLFLEAASLTSAGREDVGEGMPVATAPQQPESSTVVNLPQRPPSLLPPDETIPVAARRDVDLPTVRPSNVLDRLTRPGLERPPANVGNPAGEKEAPPLTGNPRGGLPPLEGNPLGSAGSDQPYLIQWVGSSRELLRSILPVVPEGIERDVTLQFGFGVTPTGEVTAIRPLQKGEPALEEAAVTALRQWRFQPLPPESPQETQEAAITFRFRIRLPTGP